MLLSANVARASEEGMMTLTALLTATPKPARKLTGADVEKIAGKLGVEATVALLLKVMR